MRPTLVLFSGLPGTGKSTLAERLAREFHWPLLRIEDLAACLPGEIDRNGPAFWDQAIAALLLLSEAQLKLGVSVIADSIFMNFDRFHAQAIARQSGARFLAVHTFVSDEAVWEKRVTARYQSSDPGARAASWEQVHAICPLEENYAAVRRCVCDAQAEFQPLAEVAFTPGKYHG
jgi:predicted kinase